jgi:UDP-N-acetylmuramate--alanine ligase
VRFDAKGPGPELTLRVPGRHNLLNARAALASLGLAGFDLVSAAEALASFPGMLRRLELKGSRDGARIYDDYAHHPTEVRAAIAAARQLVGGRRLWAVFEPHMYSRTALLLDRFASSFTDADEVVIVDIFASRDTDEAMRATSAEALADAIERTSATPTIATGDATATTAYVGDHLRPGDVVLVMGAGKSYQVARGLAAMLAAGLGEAARPSLRGAG